MRPRNLNFVIMAVIFLTAVYSCEKKDGLSVYVPKAVVEAYLVPGRTVSVKLTRENVFGSADSSVAIPGLELKMINNGLTYVLNDVGNGIYTSSEFSIKEGDTYELHFAYEGRQVSATTTVPDRPQEFTASSAIVENPSSGAADPAKGAITFTWNNPGKKYHHLVFTNLEPNPVRVIKESTRVLVTKPDQTSTYSQSYFSFTYLGLHRVVLYRVSAEYVALFDEHGSNSGNLSAVPTNVKNGLGIFTGLNASEDLYVTVK